MTDNIGLRKSLLVAEPDAEKVDYILQLAKKAEELSENHGYMPKADEDALTSILQEIQALTGCADYNAFYFKTLYGHSSVEEFAERAALGPAPKVDDLERNEIEDLIEKIIDCNQPSSDYYLDMLENSFPYAYVSDILYHPHKELTRHEEASEILLRKEIFDQSGDKGVTNYLDGLARQVLENKDAPMWATDWAESRLEP